MHGLTHWRLFCTNFARDERACPFILVSIVLWWDWNPSSNVHLPSAGRFFVFCERYGRHFSGR
ncbi:hypothetical protein GK1650 [Geobacillus kaustophilus HTA426]|uniref:Uncharacterized protein n=1 Tax=Geobacillus kaustophilus (strain HTA426) TaxID=235909 RepID=Q5KZF1_GEOKA|nr:hypothetical protein GK1650 [Geobacillus kaustophilus HTA426]